ncbi:MAG: hypothetical protein KDA63_20130, partial [Planctomycetales bacterium]|nr:hypothetical protein [Planctomycetales bacterium]
MGNRPTVTTGADWCRHLRALVLAAGTTTLLAAALVAAPTGAASPPPTVEPGAAPEPGRTPAGPEAPTFRLSFFNTTWPQVFRTLAERSGSELVMQRAPAGRFTRADRKKYTRTEAVRIINAEIEPEGFRVIEQGRHLVVLAMDEVRAKYSPARLPEATADVALAQTAAGVDDGAVQPATHQDGAASQRSPAFQAPGANEPVMKSPSASPLRPLSPIVERAAQPLVVDTRQRGAKEVARVIYSALRQRAELVDTGPANLPAFRVYAHNRQQASDAPLAVRRRSGEQAVVQFAVGIDSNREQLVVDGDLDTQRSIAHLIRYIDSAHNSAGQVTRLIDMTVDSARVAGQLGPALGLMVAQQTGGGDVSDAEPAPGRVHVLTNQPAAGSADAQALVDAADQPAGGQPLVQLEGLRGPVTIQDVPGVGMVVTGNQDDVDAVVRIIRELERMSAGVEADVQLLMLRHVNSSSLAELMNNVYEELTALRSAGASQQAMARIIPVVKPNAVLIIAGAADLDAILDLAEEIDQPTDPSSQFQVFPLSSAVAAEVVRTIESMYEAGEDENSGLRPRVRAVADARTNTVIVQGAPDELDEIGLLIHRIDRDVSSSVSRMQVFPLKNAVADDLADVINGALTSILSPAGSSTGQAGGGQFTGGQAAGGSSEDRQQLMAAKSVVLELLTSDGGAPLGETVRSGILSDIRVTADVRVNSLIVTAPEQSMPLMTALIAKLDAPSSNVAEIKVFSLKNSDATSTAELLQALFAQNEDEDQVGVQIVGAEDASSGLIPIRFSTDVRTNSIIAIGGAEALRVVEAVILRLDQTDVRQRQSMVVKLKNTSAELVAESINEFLESQRDLATIDPELVSNVELLEQEIIVVAEPVSNSLLISTTPRYREDILHMIERLDEAPDQVVIQVLIVEVLLENTDEFGVELGFQDSVLFNRSLINDIQTIQVTNSTPGTGVVTTTQQIVSQQGVPGFLFNNNQLGNNVS